MPITEYPSGYFKMQVFIKNKQTIAGFSENYWIAATDATTAMTKFDAYYPVRLPLLAKAAAIDYVRISNPNIRGDAAVQAFWSLNGTATATVVTQEQSLPSDIALLLRQQTSGGWHSVRYLRGIIEDWNLNGGDDPSAPQITAYTTFRQWIIDNTFHCKAPANGASGLATFLPIVSVSRQRLTVRRAGRPFGLSRGRL